MLSIAAAPRRLAMALLAGFTFAAAPAADASPIAVDGGWTNFTWIGGAGPIDSPADGFQFTSATSVVVQITDCCTIGDRFEVFVNGVSAGLTSAPDGAGPSGAFDGPASWADARLSKIALALGPGSYDIDITVTTSVSSLSSGGFIQVLGVPEPGALVLLAAAALLLACTRQASARPSPAKR
jgi:hypothetical protein